MLINKAIDMFINNLSILDRSKETIDGYRKDLNKLKDYLQIRYNGVVYIEDITIEDIENFLLYQKNRGLQPASRSRLVYTFRSFFKYLHNNGYIQKNPSVNIGNIKIKQKEREFLTKEEVYKLYDAIDHKVIKVLVLFLYYTGLRISEAINLQVEEVDMEEKLIKVISGKGNKDRVVPINEDINKILKYYYKNIRPKTESNKFFTTKRTGGVSPQYVNREIQEAVTKLGWDKKITAHILRHSYATALIKNDVNIVHVSKLLGHSSVKTTSIYTHSNIEDLKQMVLVL